MTVIKKISHPCIAILGGAFDPVHMAHVALAEAFVNLFKPTQLRLIPTGSSQQKTACQANPKQRVAMLALAFAELAKTTPLVIDQQEIQRAKENIPSYSVDTLTLLRQEVGSATSLILLIGADQLLQLQHWKNWRQLFELAHIAVATRAGFSLDTIDEAVANEFQQRIGRTEQLRQQPCGHTYLYTDLALNIASTQIRQGDDVSAIPPAVLHYIQQHHLYKNYGH